MEKEEDGGREGVLKFSSLRHRNEPKQLQSTACKTHSSCRKSRRRSAQKLGNFCVLKTHESD